MSKPNQKSPNKPADRAAVTGLSPLSIVAVAGFIAAGVAAGLLAESYYRRHPTLGDNQAAAAASNTSRRGSPADRPAVRPGAPAIDRDSPTGTAGPAGAAPLAPPPPDQAPPSDPAETPAEPIAGPDPTRFRPPTNNPGGVNGDRPPRPIRGTE